MNSKPLGWVGIVRLGLVQSALGSIVVLMTSTLNRVMVVELALPAVIPAALVGLHYAVQLSRPHWGYSSDMGQRRTPWILGGMATLGLGAILAADATVLMAYSMLGGVALAVLAFALIGAGVGAAGTSLLALLATEVAPARRPAAASITWIMMVLGIVVTAITSGHFLDPYSPQRLALVTGCVAAIAYGVTWLATFRIEQARPRTAVVERPALQLAQPPEPQPSFTTVLRQTWADPPARRFALFVFVSMLAYSAQDLILEPFAGLVFNYTIGQSTQLSGAHQGGVLLGMIVLGLIGTLVKGPRGGWMQGWTIFGCVASAASLAGLAVASQAGVGWPLAANVFALGFSNGVFAVAAIGSMMGLAGAGPQAKREGVRMGVWGAAQAIAFGVGGFLGAVGLDILRHAGGSTPHAFSIVFALEGLLFLAAAALAVLVGRSGARVSAAAVDAPLGEAARG